MPAVPDEIRESLRRYAEQAIPTGDFLRSVLANDLMTAVARADEFNRQFLREICLFVYNELPPACWGSYEKVGAWLAVGRENPRHTGDPDLTAALDDCTPDEYSAFRAFLTQLYETRGDRNALYLVGELVRESDMLTAAMKQYLAKRIVAALQS